MLERRVATGNRKELQEECANTCKQELQTSVEKRNYKEKSQGRVAKESQQHGQNDYAVEDAKKSSNIEAVQPSCSWLRALEICIFEIFTKHVYKLT